MKIGDLEIENNLVLAPMAGVTDLPFRSLCREMSCGLLYTEMVSAKAILYRNKNTEPLLQMNHQQHPIAVQLFGSDADIMGDIAAKISEERDFDIIDVNMGCPVPKIVNNHEGSALMKDMPLVEKILKNIVSKVKKPVTIKIRKGFDAQHVNAVEMAKLAEQCGVSAVAVHGRTREQYYSGHADYQIIADVKKNVSIPVIGNGDITSYEDALSMMEETGCDFVMIGRAALGNPWIFRELKAACLGEEIPPRPCIEEIADEILEHYSSMESMKGEYIAVREMRKFIPRYLKGIKGSSSLRGLINSIESGAELRATLEKHLKESGR